MGVPPWFIRRLLIAPLMPVGAVLAVGVAAVTSVLTVLLVPWQVFRGRRPRGRALNVTLFAVVYLLGETACLLACLLLWVAAGFGWKLRGPSSVRANTAVLRLFLGVLMCAARRLFGFRLIAEDPAEHHGDADAMAAAAPVIVLARHAGPGASFVLIDLLIRRHDRRPRVVLAESLRLDPSVDVLLSRLGAAFIRRGTGDAAARQIAAVAASLTAGDALVLYPEGADWTPVRQLTAVASLRRKGLRAEAFAAMRMPHVLPPHPTGVIAALQAAPACDVAVFTHTGHDGLRDFASTWAALPLTEPLHMIWWRLPAAEVPRGDDVADWLQATWADIDAWITEQAQLADVVDPATDTAAVA